MAVKYPMREIFSVSQAASRSTGLTVLIALAVSGCALNPYVHLPSPEADSSKIGNSLYGELPQAIDRANSYRDAYYKAAAEQSVLKNSIGLSIIPLSASALYLGFASSANSELAAGLGLGAAGLFGLGNFLYSAPRQAVYLHGARAVTCVVLATRPLLTTKTEYDALSSNLEQLGKTLPMVVTAMDDVESGITAVGDAAATADAVTQLGIARALVGDAGRARDAGSLLRAEYDRAGITLNEHLEMVAARVNEEVQKTEPDLSSIATIAGSLGSWAGTFGSVPAMVAATESPAKKSVSPADVGNGVPQQAAVDSQAEKDLAQALQKLATESSKLADATRAVSAHVSASQQLAAKSGDVSACSIAAADSGFSMVPDVSSIDLPAGTSASFIITDNTGIPQNVVLTPANSAVRLNTSPNGGVLVANVVADGSATTAAYMLYVRDSTRRQSRYVTVNVKARPAAAPAVTTAAAADADAWKTFLQPSETTLIATRDDAKNLQRRLAKAEGAVLVIDGKIGEETRMLLAQYQEKYKDELASLKDATPEVLRILHEDTLGKLISENSLP